MINVCLLFLLETKTALILSLSLVSIHVLAGRTTTRDASRFIGTNDHKRSQPSQRKPASSLQSRTCWISARLVPRYAVTVIYRNQQHNKQKRFSDFRKKKSKAKNKKNITTTFGKSLFLIKYRMRYANYMPPYTKDLAINQAMVAYGNRQNTTAFAQASNSDLLRSLKHWMETRLYAFIKTQEQSACELLWVNQLQHFWLAICN